VSTIGPRPRLADADLRRLFLQSKADRWGLDIARFAEALEASLDRALRGADVAPREIVRQASSLHLEDLALATACTDGHDGAWEHFIREHRPGLYRAADALDPGGGARELADALYGDLYGLQNREGERRSLLVYYHGRSALGTWLRAVLAQRVVDRARTQRRLAPLPDERVSAGPAPASPDPEQLRRVELLGRVLATAVARLEPRDRQRLGCYYRDQLTLAQTGRLLGEHEATVSRQLARTRRVLRGELEVRLRANGLSADEIAECFDAAVNDVGPLDLGEVFARKNSATERSNST
jgi:RNA polymerase sigma factor (sigma-70 family)